MTEPGTPNVEKHISVGVAASGLSHTAWVAAVPRRLASASWKMRALIAFFAGALSDLAMAPFFLSPVLLVTLPVLVWLIDTAGESEAIDRPDDERRRIALRRAASAGWFFGFGYFLFGLFWIGEAFLVEAEKFAVLLPAAVTLLPAGLALFFAAAAAASRALWRPGLARVLVLAVVVSIAEWLRGHVLTGLPWNVLGYALTWPLPLLQGASLLGIYGLTIAVVVAFASPLVALADSATADRSRRATLPRGAIGAVVSLAIVGSLAGYGFVRLAGDTAEVVPGVKLRIVQPSVPQREKWQQDKQREIFDLHLDLSRRDASGRIDDLAGVTHLVWPEAAMPFLPLESPQALSEIGALLPDSAFLVTGALRAERPVSDGVLRGDAIPGRPAVYNSMMVFNGSGGLNAIYDKIHLVPFGEYLPMQPLLEAIGLRQLTRLRGGFEVGRKPRPVIDVPGLPPLIGLICYESIFPAAVVQGADRPGLAINVTNDGWFGKTTGPHQHFHAGRVRAVEEGVPVIRAANNGISAVIDPLGRVGDRLDLDVRGVIDAALPKALPPPPYARFGDLMFVLIAAAGALAAAAMARRSTSA